MHWWKSFDGRNFNLWCFTMVKAEYCCKFKRMWHTLFKTWHTQKLYGENLKKRWTVMNVDFYIKWQVQCMWYCEYGQWANQKTQIFHDINWDVMFKRIIGVRKENNTYFIMHAYQQVLKIHTIKFIPEPSFRLPWFDRS